MTARAERGDAEWNERPRPGFRARAERSCSAGTQIDHSRASFETARATELLAAASEACTPDELARMLEAVPANVLAGLVEHALMTASNPQVPGTDAAAQQMAQLAAALGAVADALRPDHPAVAGLLDALAGQPSLEQWGGDAQTRIELAGWFVARSGSDASSPRSSRRTCRSSTLRPRTRRHRRARSPWSWARGPAFASLAPLVSADPEVRSAFVERLVRAGDDAVALWPFDIGRDVQADVATFLTDIARLNPVLPIDSQRERELKIAHVFGALVEEAIDHSSVKDAYDVVKSASNDQASSRRSWTGSTTRTCS